MAQRDTSLQRALIADIQYLANNTPGGNGTKGHVVAEGFHCGYTIPGDMLPREAIARGGNVVPEVWADPYRLRMGLDRSTVEQRIRMDG
jgi:hypothetical protein